MEKCNFLDLISVRIMLEVGKKAPRHPPFNIQVNGILYVFVWSVNLMMERLKMGQQRGRGNGVGVGRGDTCTCM